MGLVGKGVRARSSKGEAGLDTFAEGVLTFFFRSARELQTMRGFERTSNSLELGRDLPRFLGASLVAELLLAHALEEGDPELYDWISAVLARLGDAPAAEVPGWILAGAWRTLAHLGFAPGLTSCVGCGQVPAWGDGDLYRLDAASGGIRCPDCSVGRELPRVGPRAHADLLRLVQGDPPSLLPGVRGHLRYLEAFSSHHLAPTRRFRSFALLRPLVGTSEGAEAAQGRQGKRGADREMA